MRRIGTSLRAAMLFAASAAGGCNAARPSPAVPPAPTPTTHSTAPGSAGPRGPLDHPAFAGRLTEWMSRAAADRPETRVTVTARATTTAGRPALAFTMRNVSGRPVKLWPAMLPWADVQGIDVIGLAPTGEPLIWNGPIVDHGPSDAWVLRPGDSRSGVSTLETSPTLEAQLRATDVLVLWRYTLRLDDGVGVTTGAVVFPRRRSDPGATAR